MRTNYQMSNEQMKSEKSKSFFILPTPFSAFQYIRLALWGD